jgi:CheY-like chemotaxis protein
MERLKSILLVDDDETSNFLNQHLIQGLDICDNITEVHNGQEALDYLTTKGIQKPDLILLDINMPIMNGIEFLEEYTKLPEEIKARICICMLTTSLLKSDIDKIKTFDEVSEYISKPIDEDKLLEIIENYLGK